MSGPHNIEAEQALLGALLLNNDVLGKCEGLEPDHFFDPVHARIADRIINRVRAGKLASPVTLKPFLADDEGLRQLGGTDYLHRLAGAAVSVLVAPRYFAEVKALYGRRALTCALSEAQARLEDHDQDPAAVIGALEGDLSEITAASSTKPLFRQWKDALTGAIVQTNEAYRRDGVPALSTGLKALDNLIGGLLPGRTYVLAGRSSMGKTAVATAIVGNVAGPERGVTMASYEMSSEEIAHRFLSIRLAEKGIRVPYSNLTKGRVSESEFEQAMLAAAEAEDLPIYTVESENRTIPKMRAAIRAAQKHMNAKGIPLRLVVIDYLQLIKAAEKASRFDTVGDASKEAKAIARDHKVPVILLSQVNRQVESRDEKRPSLSDLRQSGEIEEDADVVIFCFRAEYYIQRMIERCGDADKRADLEALLAACKGKLELIVAKNRGGPIGTAHVRCDVATNVVEDMPAQEGLI